MIYIENQYNMTFDVCAVALMAVILLLSIFRKDKSSTRSRIFIIMVSMLLIDALSDTFVVLMRNDESYFNRELAIALNIISHMMHNLAPYMYALYIIYLIGANHYLKKWQLLIISIPAIVLVLLLVIPPATKLMFEIGKDGEYTHGPLYWYFSAEQIIYFIFINVLLFMFRKTLGKKTIFYAILIESAFLVLLLSLFIKYLRITDFLISIIILVSYTGVENTSDNHDRNTGLYKSFNFSADTRILFASKHQASVIMIKFVSPQYYSLTYGHKSIYKLLSVIGKWFKGIENKYTNAYYLKSGIFAVVIYGEHKEEAELLADKINKRFLDSWDIGDNEISVPSEIWLANIPEHIKTQEQLLDSLETPSSPANANGKVLIADELKKQSRRLRVSKAVSEALKKNRFKFYYQPIYDTKTKSIRSCESLIRLTDPELGPLSPEEFIKIAEQDGLINQIGLLSFRKTCEFYTTRHLDKLGLDFIEVNLSPIQCMDVSLSEKFKKILDEYHLDAKHIDLEITESALINSRAQMSKTIESLKKIGFTFALDDFGTGFSNYEYIISFPLSLIKIDKSILWAGDKSEKGQRILNHTIQMAKDIGCDIVTEGVENETHVNKLLKEKVRYFQGFYYSRAIPEEDFINYISKFNRKVL